MTSIVSQFERDLLDRPSASRFSLLFRRVVVRVIERRRARQAQKALERQLAAEDARRQTSVNWQKTLMPGLW